MYIITVVLYFFSAITFYLMYFVVLTVSLLLLTKDPHPWLYRGCWRSGSRSVAPRAEYICTLSLVYQNPCQPPVIITLSPEGTSMEQEWLQKHMVI